MRGPPNESGQVLTLSASSSDSSIILSPTSFDLIAADGTSKLWFKPAADANGVVTITVTLRDDASAGGAALLVSRQFTVAVRAVNDAPMFVTGADQQVGENSGAQTVTGWATGLSRGPPDESGQALDFLVAVDQPSLFSVPPSVTANGTLTFTPAANALGTTVVTVRLHDSGGTDFGGLDTSPPQTFTITVLSVNQAPVFLKGRTK